MTSLRRALKASLISEESNPSATTSLPPRTSPRSNRASSAKEDDSTSRHQRRYADDMGGDRHGFVSSDRSRAASGSSSRGQGGRRGRSSGDGEEDSSDDADSDNNSDASDSDASIVNAGRGRLSAQDRRLGSGSAWVKREKREPVPVSPPRQGVIGAAHEAEEGSQIKVKFDTGHWYGGTVLEVDSQRGIIRIDYDDGTQEVADIPDSDVVIYPWRPPELRVRPRPLSQMLEEDRGGAKAVGGGHSTANSRKHRVKSEPRLGSSPRRKSSQGRDRSKGGSKREHSRGRASNSNGRSGGGGGGGGAASKAAASSHSSSGEESEKDNVDDDERERQWSGEAGGGGTTALTEVRRNGGRWQQKSGKPLPRGRPSSSVRPGQQRKRPGGGNHSRNGNAPKRARSTPDAVRTGNNASAGASMSESGSAASEEEEELDDTSLGIKAKARSPRASPRRKSSTAAAVATAQQQKSKGVRRGSSDGGAAKKAGTVTPRALLRPQAGSSALSGSSSDYFMSESSSSQSSSESGSENPLQSDVAASRNNEQSKTAAVASPGSTPPTIFRSKSGSTQKVEGERDKSEKNQAEVEHLVVNKERGGTPGRDKSNLARNKSAQCNGNVHKGNDLPVIPHQPQESKKSKEVKPQQAARSKCAIHTNTAVKPEPKQAESSHVSRGWLESTDVAHKQEAVQGKKSHASAPGRAANGIDAGGRGRGRGGRGSSRGGGGGGKAKQTRPVRLESSNRSVERRRPSEGVSEVSTPEPQERAERKEIQSPDLSSSLRKSPRSKETPSSSRAGDGVMPVRKTGAPEIAEAKGTTIEASMLPLLLPPGDPLSNDGFYGWQGRSSRAPGAPEDPELRLSEGGNLVKESDILMSETGDNGEAGQGRSLKTLGGQGDSEERTPEESIAGEGIDSLRDGASDKLETGSRKTVADKSIEEEGVSNLTGRFPNRKTSPTPAILDQKIRKQNQQPKCDQIDSEVEARMKPKRLEIPPKIPSPKKSPMKLSPTKKSPMKLSPTKKSPKKVSPTTNSLKKNSPAKARREKVLDVKAGNEIASLPAPLDAKRTTPTKFEDERSTSAASSPLKNPTSSSSAEVDSNTVELVLKAEEAEEELGANSLRDAASGALQVDSVNEPTTVPETESRAPVVDPQKPSPSPAAVSPPNQNEIDAMEVDSEEGDDDDGDNLLKSEDAAVKRRLYCSDSGEDESGGASVTSPNANGEHNLKATKSGKVDKATARGGAMATKGSKAEATVSGSDKAGRKAESKPARKRPRSEEKAGLGAKSDWPAPVLSRPTLPELQKMDVDECDRRDMDPTATETDSSNEEKKGDVGLVSTAPATERLPPSVELNERAPTSSSEKEHPTDEAADPLPVSIETSSAVENVTKEDADGGHQGQDPGSGKKRKTGDDERFEEVAPEVRIVDAVPSPELPSLPRAGDLASNVKSAVSGRESELEPQKRERTTSDQSAAAAFQGKSTDTVVVTTTASGNAAEFTDYSTSKAEPKPEDDNSPPATRDEDLNLQGQPVAEEPPHRGAVDGSGGQLTTNAKPEEVGEANCHGPSAMTAIFSNSDDSKNGETSTVSTEVEPKGVKASTTCRNPDTEVEPESSKILTGTAGKVECIVESQSRKLSPTSTIPESSDESKDGKPSTKNPELENKDESDGEKSVTPTEEPANKNDLRSDIPSTAVLKPVSKDDSRGDKPAATAAAKLEKRGEEPSTTIKPENKIDPKDDETSTTPTEPEMNDESGKDDDDEEKKPSASKPARSGSEDMRSGSDDASASEEPRHVGRKRAVVTRFEPSMDPDRNRLGNQRPERHERQAAVLAIKRLAASAPIRRASRGRGHDSGGRGKGARRGRGGRGGRGSRGAVQQQVESEEDDEDDDDEEEGVDWVQCDNCEEWWTLPSSMSADDLPDVWHCRMQNWGKPVVDCLAPKEPPRTTGKSGRGGAQLERKSAGRGAGRGLLSATPSTPMTVAASMTSVSSCTPIAPPPPPAPLLTLPLLSPSAVTPALAESTAAAEAEAAVTLVAVAAIAASPMEGIKIVQPPEPLPSDRIAGAVAVEISKDREETPMQQAVICPEPKKEAPVRLPAVDAVVAEVQPNVVPPPVLSLDVEKVPSLHQKPIATGKACTEEKPQVPVRRKRRREGALNGSSSDEDGGKGARDGAGSGEAEESRPRSNSSAKLGGTRGRGRKNSSLGRDAVAFLIKAAESRRDNKPTPEETEAKGELHGGSAADVRISTGVTPATTATVPGAVIGIGDATVKADQWVSCDHKNCGKWRRVPPGVDLGGVDKWYCQMAIWSPATASCEHPEDSADMLTPATGGTSSGRSFLAGGGGGRGNGGGSCRGRRLGSRARAAPEASEAVGDTERSWRKDGDAGSAAGERRSSEGGVGSSGGGRGRGRSKKEDVLWVQCDKCLRWRKLALGMRLEDLPDKWYCQMNTWSIANHCAHPDEYDEETKKAALERENSSRDERNGCTGGVVAGGLLSRGAGGRKQKAYGRLSYREILFNNDGKLRPPYSLGPCPSASAGFLFPKPGDTAASRAESDTTEDPSPTRTGFHYSEKYCPASGTGPERPPPRQDLLTASFRLTNLLSSSLSRSNSGGSSSQGSPWSPLCSNEQQPTGTVDTSRQWRANNMSNGLASGFRGGGEGWSSANQRADKDFVLSNGTSKPSVAMAVSSTVANRRQPSALQRRRGTYEREREERGFVLHHLTIVTTSRPTKSAGNRESSNANGGCTTANVFSVPPYPNGISAADLMATMRERPWEGRASAGSPQEWVEWLDLLEPTLERHLRWLAVDGLAARSDTNSADSKEARFAAVKLVPVEPDDGAEGGGKESTGRPVAPSTGGKVAAGGGPGGVGGNKAACLSMLNGGMRIMKSRPLKMVKPWR